MHIDSHFPYTLPPSQRKANGISEQALQMCNSGTDLYTIVADATMWTAGRTIKLTSGAPLHAHHHSFNLHILVQRCSKIIACLFIFMSCSGKTCKHRISYISYPVNHTADMLVVTISIRPYKDKQGLSPCMAEHPLLLLSVSIPTLFALGLVISNNSTCIHIPSFALKISVVQKIQDWQIVHEVSNHHCDLDLEHSTPVFSQGIPACENVPSS